MLHRIEVASWHHYDYMAIEAIGVIPRVGGLDVDYDALDASVVFAIEIAPQLLVDGRSWEARTGQPETPRQSGGDATHAFGPPMPQTQVIKASDPVKLGRVLN